MAWPSSLIYDIKRSVFGFINRKHYIIDVDSYLDPQKYEYKSRSIYFHQRLLVETNDNSFFLEINKYTKTKTAFYSNCARKSYI